MIKDNQTHSSDALERLPRQFNDSENLKNLVLIYADRSQDLNDKLIELLNGRSVNDATGQQLDNIATIFNLTRKPGESDAAFRARILASTTALARSGEPSHIIDSYITLTNASSVFYREIFPAGVEVAAHLASDSFTDEEEFAISNAMENIKAGGVSMVLVVSPDSDYLTLDNSDNADGADNGQIDIAHGLGSTLHTDGGQLSRVLISTLALIPGFFALAGEPLMQAGEPLAMAGYLTDLI